jgi:hypothetical protein
MTETSVTIKPGDPLQEWFNVQRESTPDEMLWKGASGQQVMFARDDLRYLVAAGLDYEDARNICTVISTHRSKSVELPVYCWSRPDIGLQLVARGNFYNWKLSVLSAAPINADFSALFKTTPPIAPDYTGDPLSSCYFEGFPEDLIFGYYEPSDKRRWSAEIGGDHGLWTTFFLLMRSIGAIKPSPWRTPESHRAEMAAEKTRRDAREKALRDGIAEQSKPNDQ